ncbi:hypothetical protein [Variovorax fucosicus]|uniref:hypothetical protein n=1 Tax=Variovorax fucosicus TaxID=3053517 RepID=UPI00257626FC|nr:hypothetical protein [Variovorax sp. J22G47]MDM0057344.1 hypothetical protein [Variovorax sp. J22G47]
MEDSIIEYWMPEECAAGLCTELEIGKLKPPMLEAKRLAQRATTKAVKALIDVAEQSEDLQAKVKAAQVLLDRGWGKADQHVTQGTTVKLEMPWISARRLMYQEAMVLSGDIKAIDKVSAAVPFEQLPPHYQEQVVNARPLPKPENGGNDPT